MSQKKKTTAQSKRPRKAPSNQTGGTAWGKKAAAAISGKMQSADMKKLILLNFPYIIAFYMVEKAAWLYRHCNGDTIVDRLMVLFMNFGLAYKSYLPSVHPFDLLVGLIGAAALKAVIYFKGKNAKKYRQGEEYGSARWGNAKDIEPFIDPVFENAKDISKKISLSYQMRREKGIPTSWCTPYGYQLNQQGNKFEATEDAKWVKLIYQWYLAGVSTNEIARRLEFLEVARPNERLNRKLHEGDDPTYNKWHPSTVLRILNSSAYIGELVSGKTQTASYKGIGLHPVEKKEWHIVENAHEAIILKSDFEKVQARREQNKEKRERAMARSKATREKCYNHLSGMVYCGCCRRNMTFERRVHGTVKETHYGVFICKRKKNTTPCAYHAVPEKMLMMVAMDQIHHLVSTMCEEEKLVKDMMRGSNLDSARSIKMKENSILFRIQEAEERRLRLYEDYKAEILDEDEYSQLKEHYIAEKQRLEHELQKQRQRALELEKRIKICDAQMERMRGILNQNEFDEELVHELIKRIYVGMDNSVEVEFKCSDPYQEVLAIMSEVQNE